MPDINRSADLTEYLTERDSRLRKIERQLAVPRRAYSDVTTSQTTAFTGLGGVALTTPDRISVVTTARSIVHFYVEVTIANTGVNSSNVFLYDETDVSSRQILSYTGVGPVARASVPGSTTGVDPAATFGGFVSSIVTVAGQRDYSLRYSVVAGTGTFSNRKLYAWIQPF
jgi:hypothetical protein